MNPIPDFHAFTIEYTGKVREIVTDAGIFTPIPTGGEIDVNPADPHIFHTKALWDTGASHCAITEKAAKALNIKPIRTTRVSYGDGGAEANVYLVSVFLPNKLLIPMVQVTECKNEHDNWDLIIGMDIIGHSDFSITNVGRTKMSFRLPSVKEVDYVKEANAIKAARKKLVGRNDPCPCGSGKKFKHCCGNPASK